MVDNYFLKGAIMKKLLFVSLIIFLGMSYIFALPSGVNINLSVINNSDTSDDGAYMYSYTTKKDVQIQMDVSGLPGQVEEYDSDGNAQPVEDHYYCVVLVIEKGIPKREDKVKEDHEFYYEWDTVHNSDPTYLYYNESGWSIESESPITSDNTYSTNDVGGIGGIISSIPETFFYNDQNQNLDFGRYRAYAEVRKYTVNEDGEKVVSPLSENDATFDTDTSGEKGYLKCTIDERVSNVEYMDFGWIDYPFTLNKESTGHYWSIDGNASDASPESLIKYYSNSEDASNADFSFEWTKPTGLATGGSDVEFTIEYAYQEDGDYKPLRKSDGSLVTMSDFQYNTTTHKWTFLTNLAEIFGDYYGWMFFKIQAHDPDWPNESGMDEDGDGNTEEWDGYYESLNKIAIDYHKLGYSLLKPEDRDVPYYQGEIIKFRWAAPAKGATYAIQYRMIADAQGNTVTDSEWKTHQEFGSETYSYDAQPENVFSGFGTYEIRIKGKRTSNGEIYYSDNTVEIEYQSINTVIENFVLQDSYTSGGEQRHTDFIMQNSFGSSSSCPLYINWIENQTVLNYYYTIQEASDPSPSDSDFQEITGAISDGSLTGEKYYEFSVNTIDTITGPGEYSYYFKFVTEGGHAHVIKKNFNVHQFMWKVVPSFDESYFQVFALGEGLTDPEKNLDLLVLSDDMGNSWKLNPKGTGLYISPDDFNTKIYDDTVNFTLECTMRKTDPAYYVQIGPSVQFSMVQMNNEDYTVTKGLRLHTTGSIQMGYMNVNYPEYHGLRKIQGRIYYITSDNYSSLNIKVEDGYQPYKWESSGWVKTDDIDEAGYYAVKSENNTVPKVKNTALKGNYPNPFNPSTTIKFDIDNAGKVDLFIYNTKGKLVKKLIENKHFNPGSDYEKDWHGKNKHGKRVASGIYYYVLSVNGNRYIKKMVLLK